jgi:YjbE family integral membrane protein
VLPWGLVRSPSHYLVNGLSIVAIDLLLAGDNALVIAMAVRALPRRQRRMALLCGAWLAVVLRVAITFVAAKLLELEFIQFAGGLFVLWIAVKVLTDASEPERGAVSPRHVWRAIGSIMVADLTMSTDNILAIAGASKGDIWLIVFGLGLSIPLVISSSTLLARIMDKYPLTLYVGAGILGKVGGDMLLTDTFIRKLLHPSDALRYAVDAILVVAIVVTGRRLSRRRAATPRQTA